MKRLLGAGLLHGDAMTVTGKTLRENVEATETVDDQPVVYQMADPQRAFPSHHPHLF